MSRGASDRARQSALLAFGMFACGLSVTGCCSCSAFGCLVLFVGVALISSRLVTPLASILGWPAAQVAGAAGRLARENAVRNPGRTAATASALMIGLALVTFVAVLGEGLRNSSRRRGRAAVRADYVVTSDDGFGPLARAGDAVGAASGRERRGVRQGSARSLAPASASPASIRARSPRS